MIEELILRDAAMSARTLLSYDALDRLATITSHGEAMIQSFYDHDHLSTELQGSRSFSFFRSSVRLHAQHQIETSRSLVTLLATDFQRAVLSEVAGDRRCSLGYMPYGYRHPQPVMNSLLAFNGERPSPITGHYLLGNGRRAFNPVLMRFNSPDRLSPFGRGGVNAFAYCKGDPINFYDPSGQFFQSFLNVLKSVQGVLKAGWKSYALVLRPKGNGLSGVATLASRAGYVTTAAGWGLQSSGYAAGASVTNVGGALIATAKILKVTDKLVSVAKNGKLADGLRYRVRQLRGQVRTAQLDPENGSAHVLINATKPRSH